jgi:hypothetical protein
MIGFFLLLPHTSGLPSSRVSVKRPAVMRGPMRRRLFKRYDWTKWAAVEYSYVVAGRVYDAEVNDAEGDIAHATIHYDSRDRAKHSAGAIAPPWIALLFTCGIAAFLSFVGYRFR